MRRAEPLEQRETSAWAMLGGQAEQQHAHGRGDIGKVAFDRGGREAARLERGAASSETRRGCAA